jgi:uncharacterized protein
MTSQSKKWMKNPWVWLIIALPLSSVIAGIATVIITSQNQPEMIVDDYYKKGKAINQELSLYNAFKATGINLQVKMDGSRFELKASELIPALKVTLVHSTQGKRDLSFVVTPNASGSLAKTLENEISGKWNLFVEPMDGSWKVQQKLVFPTGSWLSIGSE